ncbi:MAG: ATP-dependent DNA helicase RecG [Bacteroidetes bacterium CG2_30_32_10]|nr:MAG: ATP-dependent DNA helicase RecG [Bacteroidetes bacterium CG2_30_32_10]
MLTIPYLDTPIEYLKGVGPLRADVIKKELNIFTFGQMLSLFPFRHVDKSKFYKINEINPDLPYVQIKGKLSNMQIIGQKRAMRMVADFVDETGRIELVWFNSVKWIKDTIKPNIEYVVFGKPTLFNNKYNIVHPEIDIFYEQTLSTETAFQPVYNSTEKLKTKGLDSKGISKLIKTILSNCKGNVPEILTDELVNNLKLLSREQAFYQIHYPSDMNLLGKAQFRFKFEELFFIQIRLLKYKLIRAEKSTGQVFSKVGESFNSFYNNCLPFELTNAQKKVIKEIRKDTGSGKQMNRLLQGDVGSGKTIVALMNMLIALDNGFQTCLMSPTEILANQHFVTLKKLLNNLDISIELLTGSTRIAKRRLIHQQLMDGELKILVGTHALIEDKVQFKNLGLVVIDEQHRFGVAQRAKLWKKNTIPPHILVMTATPIPRTLAMTIYGDLDFSVIDELPPGRKAIKTIHKYDSARLQVFAFMKQEIKQGRQIYVVYPLINESEKLDLKFLMDGYESIVREFPLPEYAISIVHGQMKSKDKEYEMQRFVKGETQIMVSTTVIEVGVDVPNASVMIIENADRFGLSQLHQLRGRVGRGAEQSYCILMTDFKLTSDAKTRIDTMVRTSDGFEIAEVDLKLRGPGDILGTQQSGIVDLRIANLARDEQIIQLARNTANDILKDDPAIKKEKNKKLLLQIKKIEKYGELWGRIS